MGFADTIGLPYGVAPKGGAGGGAVGDISYFASDPGSKWVKPLGQFLSRAQYSDPVLWEKWGYRIPASIVQSSIPTGTWPTVSGIYYGFNAGGRLYIQNNSLTGVYWTSDGVIFTLCNGLGDSIAGISTNGSGIWVAVRGSSIYQSTNGTNWNLVINYSTYGKYIISPTSNKGMNSVAYGAGIFVIPLNASGTGGGVLYSSDGVNWNQYQPQASSSGGGFIVFGGDGRFIVAKTSNSVISAYTVSGGAPVLSGSIDLASNTGDGSYNPDMCVWTGTKYLFYAASIGGANRFFTLAAGSNSASANFAPTYIAGPQNPPSFVPEPQKLISDGLGVVYIVTRTTYPAVGASSDSGASFVVSSITTPPINMATVSCEYVADRLVAIMQKDDNAVPFQLITVPKANSQIKVPTVTEAALSASGQVLAPYMRIAA